VGSCIEELAMGYFEGRLGAAPEACEHHHHHDTNTASGARPSC
jgi:hypothetical protein